MDNNEPQNPSEPGGSGGLAQPASRSHLQLIQRAIRHDWPIPRDLRQEVINELANIVRNSKSKRAKVAAIKALLAGDAINVKREGMDQKADWWQFKADAPPPDQVTVNVLNVSADDKRTGLSAIRERLGIGDRATPNGHAAEHEGDSNGAARNPPSNGNGKPSGNPPAAYPPPS